ncbi:MAG: hypothetical protein ACLR23_19495 [Clostridia bacterium]
MYYHTVLHIRPSASSIRSVTFVQPQFDAEVPTYAALQIRNIEYRDERLNEIIASSLNSTLEHVVNNEWDDMIYSEDHPVTLEAVRIDLGHFTILRTVMIPLEYKSEVMAIMQEDAAFQEAFMDLPSPERGQSILSRDSPVGQRHTGDLRHPPGRSQDIALREMVFLHEDISAEILRGYEE